MYRFLQRLVLFSSIFLTAFITHSQDKPVTFTVQQEGKDDEYILSIKAIIKDGSKLYSIKSFGEEAPINTQINFDSSARGFIKDNLLEAGSPKTELDASFNVNVAYFTDSVEWQQKLNLTGIDSALIPLPGRRSAAVLPALSVGADMVCQR